MTTVDFSVEDRNRASLLHFHNGLFGTATDLLHTAWQLAQAGRMQPSKYNVAEFESAISGDVLRELLASVGVEEDSSWPGAATPDDVSRFLANLDDDTTYWVVGYEV